MIHVSYAAFGHKSKQKWLPLSQWSIDLALSAVMNLWRTPHFGGEPQRAKFPVRNAGQSIVQSKMVKKKLGRPVKNRPRSALSPGVRTTTKRRLPSGGKKSQMGCWFWMASSTSPKASPVLAPWFFFIRPKHSGVCRHPVGHPDSTLASGPALVLKMV